MTSPDPTTASGPEVLPAFDGQASKSGPPVFELGDLADLGFRIDVPLGHLEVNIRELLDLRVGSTLRLNRQTGEHLEITANGTPLALGEVRVHGERFAVRITQILRGVSLDEVEGEDRHDSKDSSKR